VRTGVVLAIILLALAGSATLFLAACWRRSPTPSPTPSGGEPPIQVSPPVIPMVPKPGKRAEGRAQVSSVADQQVSVHARVEGIEGAASPADFSLDPGEVEEVRVETALPPRGAASSGSYFLVLDYGSGEVRVPLQYPAPGQTQPPGGGAGEGEGAGGGEQGQPSPGGEGAEGPLAESLSLEIVLQLTITGGGSTTMLAGDVTTHSTGSVVREETLILTADLTRMAGNTYGGTGTLELQGLYVNARNHIQVTSPEGQCDTNQTYQYGYSGSWEVLVYVVLDDEGRIVEIDVNNLPDSKNRTPDSFDVPGDAETLCVLKTGSARNSGPLPSKLIGAYLEEHIESLVEWVGPLESGVHRVSATYSGPWQGLEALVPLMPSDVSFRVEGTASVVLASP